MQETQVRSEYRALKPVTILGRNYAAGDTINDPEIKPGVLATLLNTKRIGVKMMARAEAGVPPAAPSEDRLDDPRLSQDGQKRALEGVVVQTTPDTPQSADDGQSPDLRAWRAKWADLKTGQSFRLWLYAQAGARDIRANGSNEEIVARLKEAGIDA